MYQNQSSVEIVEILLKENGVHNFSFVLGYKHLPREFCIQYDESDLTFIQRLLADERVFYYFVFDQERHERHERHIVFHDSYLSLNQVITVPYPPPLRFLDKEDNETLFISPKLRFDGDKFIITR
ncbi:hypothetical protein ID852_09000 [Xenorhabdus sp. 42]|nr:hypothetical protein [Xenorhabdus sp. 42]